MRRTWIRVLTGALLCGAVWAGAPAGAADPLPPLPGLPGSSPSPSPSPTPSPSPSPSRTSQPAPKPPPPPTAAPQDRWALLVGVTNYRGKVKDTIGGANDARLARDVLLRSGWRSDRIRILTDGQATGRAVADGISWLQRNSSSRTFSFFHYSGHVKQKNGREYLWPVDNAYIADNEVSRVLRAIQGTAWTNISGCEAGGFDEGLSSKRHLFTASSKVTEKSYENPKTRFSVWSGLLYDEAIRDRRADADRDGGVSVQEAFKWAAPRATTFTRNQRPNGPQTPQMRGGAGSLNLKAPRL